MQESRIDFKTNKTVKECANAFRQAVTTSYGAGRKLARAASMLRGSDTGGIEFFTPESSPFSSLNGETAWSAGAFVPGHNLMTGATRMAVHIYVVDHGDSREVQLVGPRGFGDKGSTERLLRTIAGQF